MAGFPVPFAIWGPRSSPPTPLRAVYFRATGFGFVKFDIALRHRQLNTSNWSATAANRRLVFDQVWIYRDRVNFNAHAGPFRFRPNTVSYNPPPFDVHSVQTIPAPAFASFPLTVW